jgi:glycosyltransferase involved in cell wall biosynthesis
MAAHHARGPPMTERLRILHVIASLDGYGHARMLRSLAASQPAAGAQVTVGAMTAEGSISAELRQSGVGVKVVGSHWSFDPITALRINRLRRSKPAPQIVHAWDLRSLAHVSCLRRRSSSERLIARVNAAELDSAAAHRAVRLLRGNVDAFVTPDSAAQRRLQTWGVDQPRIQVIRPGIPRQSAVSRQRGAWLNQWELPTESKVIATAGPLTRIKAFDEVIWCFELVRILYPTARLLILGDGPDRARLERFADGVSEPGCIRFLGYRPDIAEILPHADVYWQLDASRTTPLALLEAQAAGVPVVVSDTPAHRAAIAVDETGFVAPLGNRAAVARATDDLFSDPARAERMGAAGAEVVAAHWSIEAALVAYDRLYATVLSR